MEIGTTMSRRTVLAAGSLGVAMCAVGGRAVAGPAITVHKDASCGCCAGWIAHLKQNGFATTAIDEPDMAAIKQRLGVPDDLGSCHTAEIAGYIIEGHVPAVAIARLLVEKPKAVGLSAPGMPIGSARHGRWQAGRL